MLALSGVEGVYPVVNFCLCVRKQSLGKNLLRGTIDERCLEEKRKRCGWLLRIWGTGICALHCPSKISHREARLSQQTSIPEFRNKTKKSGKIPADFTKPSPDSKNSRCLEISCLRFSISFRKSKSFTRTTKASTLQLCS